MVKIIRDFVPKTRFLILCDCSCSQMIAGEAEPITDEQRASGLTEEIEQKQIGSFALAAAQQGWKVGFDRQICPQHVKKETGNESRILLPHGRFNAQK
jgi:hypothetical protein